MKNLYPLILLFLVSVNHIAAQAPLFSQFHLIPAAVNPAYVSASNDLEVQSGYRRQWPQLQQGFDGKFARASMRSCSAPIGLGVFVNELYDPFFEYREREFGLQLGVFGPWKDKWNNRKNRFVWHGGFQASVGNHRVNYARLVFSGQLDPVFGIQGPPSAYFLQDGSRVQTFQIGAGFLGRGLIKGRSEDLPASVGFSVLHAGGSRDVSFLRIGTNQSPLITAHASLTTPVAQPINNDKAEKLYLNWIVRFEYEGRLQQATTGAVFQYRDALLGINYLWNSSPASLKNTHSLMFSLGAKFALSERVQWSLSYAYDAQLSGLGQAATGGAHELIASFYLPNACVFKSRRSGQGGRGPIRCPEFDGPRYWRLMNY